MDSIQQYLQDEIDTVLDHTEVMAKHAINAIEDVVGIIGQLTDEEQRDYVLMMDQHIRQVEVILSFMRQANTLMRMKNRYDDEKDT